MVKNWFYNTLIKKTTNAGYQSFFQKITPEAKIFDIGIGNGLMFHDFHQTILDLKLNIYGIDLNKQYLKQSEKLIVRYNLTPQVKIEQKNFITDSFEGVYDYVFFSMSFPLIQEQGKALDKAIQLLKKKGQIAFFQTHQLKPSKVMEKIKPKLKYVSTIDFGQVTYEDKFLDLLAERKLEIISRDKLHNISPTSEVVVLFVQQKD